ncbi:MAG: hypothetical protein ACOVOR_04090 [Rhabdochlamydiaceae bacterium]
MSSFPGWRCVNPIDKPTTFLEKRSHDTDTYNQPSSVFTYVISETKNFIWLCHIKWLIEMIRLYNMLFIAISLPMGLGGYFRKIFCHGNSSPKWKFPIWGWIFALAKSSSKAPL